MSNRIRRTPEQLVADLEKQIEEVKRRAAQKKAKADPALRHVTGAVRSIDKALAETKDVATREALSEARSSLAAVLSLSGVVPANGSKPKATSSSGPKVSPDKVLDYVRKNPGGRSVDIAEALGSDAAGIRPALQDLKEGKKVKTEGKARGMR